MHPKLIRVSEFRKRYFEGTAPTVDSIKRMIKLGELKGKQLGGVYYVILDEDFFAGDRFLEVEPSVSPPLFNNKKSSPRVEAIIQKYADLI